MSGRKILIVEDESVVRLHLRQIIEKMGHRVVGLAASAEEAWEMAAAERPDLVLMDIHLRGQQDGVDAAREIVRRHGSAIVFATAFADDETIRRTEQAGAVGYILKPFAEQAVRATLATALREYDRMIEVREKEQSLAGLIGSLGEAVLQLDSDLRVKFLNPAAESLVWTPEGNLVGRRLQEVLHPSPEDAQDLLDVLNTLVDRNERIALPAFSHLDSQGGDILLSGAIEPIKSKDAGYVVMLRDLSRRLEYSPAPTDLAEEIGGPRLLIYSHDTFGLGHLRRSLNLATSLAQTVPDLSIMLVTGSAMAHRFQLPAGVDYVKLPAVRKMASERYSSRSLGVSDEDVLSIRSNLLLRVVRDFRPKVLLADHSPAGMKGELRPTLTWVRDHLPECRTVIGLRDIIDDPAVVKATWRSQGIYQLLQEFYDHIVVYGDQDFYDPVVSYGFPAAVADRTCFVGHVVEQVEVPQVDGLQNEIPKILVTTGGGDGAVEEVAGGVLAALAAGHINCEVEVTVLPGPLVPEETLALLEIEARKVGAKVLSFVESSSPYMAAADLVICTAGYNTATQVLRYAQRALMIPRVMHRQEQLIRATRLAELGCIRFLHPDRLDPQTLGETISAILATKDDALLQARTTGVFNFQGAENFARFCTDLLKVSREATEVTHD